MRTMAIAAFLTLLAAGVVYGVIHDVGSHATGVTAHATVLDVTRPGVDFKGFAPKPTLVKVRLSDGATLTVRAPGGYTQAPGAEVKLAEMVTPWGATWYALAN